MMFITSFTSPVFSSNPFFLVFVRDTAKEKKLCTLDLHLVLSYLYLG